MYVRMTADHIASVSTVPVPVRNSSGSFWGSPGVGTPSLGLGPPSLGLEQ